MVMFSRNNAGYIASFLIFAIAGITDWLDGYLARTLNAQSSFGKMLDPVADKLLVATALVILVHQDRADVLPAIAIICREILVSGLREHLAGTNISMPVTRLAKYKTALQIIAISALLLAPALDEYFGINSLFQYFGRFCLVGAAILTLITGYAYLKKGLGSI